MTMADTIAVMNKGVIEQMGAPAELYENPRTTFVANFLGQSNLIDGSTSPDTDGDRLMVDMDGTKVAAADEPRRVETGGSGSAYVPRRCSSRRSPTSATTTSTRFRRVVSDVSFVGVSTQYLVRMPWGQELTVFEQNTGARPFFRR